MAEPTNADVEVRATGPGGTHPDAIDHEIEETADALRPAARRRFWLFDALQSLALAPMMASLFYASDRRIEGSEIVFLVVATAFVLVLAFARRKATLRGDRDDQVSITHGLASSADRRDVARAIRTGSLVASSRLRNVEVVEARRLSAQEASHRWAFLPALIFGIGLAAVQLNSGEPALAAIFFVVGLGLLLAWWRTTTLIRGAKRVLTRAS